MQWAQCDCKRELGTEGKGRVMLHFLLLLSAADVDAGEGLDEMAQCYGLYRLTGWPRHSPVSCMSSALDLIAGLADLIDF